MISLFMANSYPVWDHIEGLPDVTKIPYLPVDVGKEVLLETAVFLNIFTLLTRDHQKACLCVNKSWQVFCSSFLANEITRISRSLVFFCFDTNEPLNERIERAQHIQEKGQKLKKSPNNPYPFFSSSLYSMAVNPQSLEVLVSYGALLSKSCADLFFHTPCAGLVSVCISAYEMNHLDLDAALDQAIIDLSQECNIEQKTNKIQFICHVLLQQFQRSAYEDIQFLNKCVGLFTAMPDSSQKTDLQPFIERATMVSQDDLNTGLS